jgi:hypothetical protein
MPFEASNLLFFFFDYISFILSFTRSPNYIKDRRNSPCEPRNQTGDEKDAVPETISSGRIQKKEDSEHV